jgi:uncharacterized protein YlxP (DUF503 family)
MAERYRLRASTILSTMWVAQALVEVSLPGSGSLKDKRRTVRSLLARLRRLGLSAAEVGAQGEWRRAEVGVASCWNTKAEAERALQAVREETYASPEVGSAEIAESVSRWP